MKRTNLTVLKTKVKLLSIVFLLMFFSSIGKSQNLEVQGTLNEGTVLELILHSSSLENNFLGDSPDREVSVYLPPGYNSSPDKHYPVIYFLHSYGLDHTAFFGGYPWNEKDFKTIDFKTICDALINSGEIDSMIVVSPNAYNKYWGSFYVNSSVTGYWEDFIVEDLIHYIDSNFRTLPQKESRGLAGHSMGGYGAMWLIMNNPSLYNAVYTLSGHPEFEGLYLDDNMIEAVNAESLEGLGWRQVVGIALAAAIAPDSLAPPFYAQFPLNKDGELVDSIWQKWLQSEPLAMLPSLKDSLLQLKAIQFDVGTNDSDAGFITSNRNFSQALNDLGIPHVFEEHNGDHSNKMVERIETKLLPFFSANLSKHLLSDTVSIPDIAFLNALIEEGVDTNEDGLISYDEAEAVTNLYVSKKSISELTGIEAFINLENLYCHNNQLSKLDVSKNSLLKELLCSYNQLTSLDFSNNTALLGFSCRENQINSLDISGCTSLEHLSCEINQLPSLDVSTNTALQGFNCSWNQIASLDVTQNTALVYFSCEHNQLTSLDVSKNTNLEEFNLSENQLTTLDISNNRNLRKFTLPSGGACLSVENMPSLTEICVWEGFNLDDYSPPIETTGSPNICFQTDCNGDCSIVGIDESYPSEFSIYPNPTNSHLTIETDHPDHCSIEITSLNGQQILSEEMEGASHQIDISSFQNGIYFITIRSKDFVTTRKIVKY